MSLRTIVLPILAVGAGFLLGCPPPEGTTPAVDLAAEEQAIRAQSSQWMEWARARDGAAIADGIFLEDAVTMFDDEIYHGRAAILAHMQEEYADNPDATISWTTTLVRVAASGDLAYELGSWVADPDGAGEAGEMRGEYATVWRKVDGTWRCAVDAGAEHEDEEEDEDDEDMS